MAVARYWRERYRLDQAALLGDDVRLAIRCEPDDPWFEADVGLALQGNWDLREAPSESVLARTQARLRERYPAASIEPLPPAPGNARATWLVRREGRGGVDAAARPDGASGPRLEVRAFPRDDEEFRRRVAETVESVSGPDAASGRLLRDLATNALRRDYPNVRIVEQDSLAQESGVTVWYVYRDGSAVPRAGQVVPAGD